VKYYILSDAKQFKSTEKEDVCDKLVWRKPKLADTYFSISAGVERNAPAPAIIIGIVGVLISFPPM